VPIVFHDRDKPSDIFKRGQGFLNGRKLSDDVIDAELGLVTEGTVKTDCVTGNDVKFWPNFPYLAAAH